MAKKKDPPENILLVVLVAGHGLKMSGNQTALLHKEIDSKTGFLKEFAVEKKMRQWAEIFPNSYIVCIFSCSRETFDP